MLCVKKGVNGGYPHRPRRLDQPDFADDPVKNRQEADSIVVRDKLWNWYHERSFAPA